MSISTQELKEICEKARRQSQGKTPEQIVREILSKQLPLQKLKKRYVKVLGLIDQAGYYDNQSKTIVVDFRHGILRGVITSFHEFLHKILDMLPIEDWVDIIWPLIEPSTWKQKRIKTYLRAIFSKAEVLVIEPYQILEVIEKEKKE